MDKLHFCPSVGTHYVQISCTNMQDPAPIKDESGTVHRVTDCRADQLAMSFHPSEAILSSTYSVGEKHALE
jgi:hypothetical protein